METEDFNKELSMLTDDFIKNWLSLVDIYAQENELGPNHKLCALLFSHLGLERKMSQKIWEVGSSYMDAVVALGKEMEIDVT
jgi:hypothetical protein